MLHLTLEIFALKKFYIFVDVIKMYAQLHTDLVEL